MSIQILYVDDDAASRRLIYTMAERLGYDFHSANDGERGIEAARALLPDVILLDVMLPGISGEETCERMKNLPELAEVPIVALTAQTMDGDRAYLLSVGFDGYLAKPVNRLIFQNIINQVLRQKR